MEYVKICGLKSFEDIQLCINNNATAVGFIYNVPESPRNMEESEINNILKKISKDIKTVLVFKPKNIHEIKDIAEKINTNLYQIHGNFSINELDKIPKNLKKKNYSWA